MTREEAIEILTRYKKESEEDYYVKRAKALDIAIKALEQEPRRGKWIGRGYFITCSCCNEMSYPFDYGGYGSIYHDYCPNCGADMREVEE